MTTTLAEAKETLQVITKMVAIAQAEYPAGEPINLYNIICAKLLVLKLEPNLGACAHLLQEIADDYLRYKSLAVIDGFDKADELAYLIMCTVEGKGTKT